MATKTFEKAMQQLEKIVEELDAGELPLEASLKKFEEAVALSRYCSEKLDESEKRIALLLKTPDGGLEEHPLDEEP
jgi:exodeoxyribonuclease VII small subunit